MIKNDSSKETVIGPEKHWLLNLSELWEYRELLFFFTWRDVKVKYKQTILGVLWAIIQPVLMMVVFTVVFGRMAKVSSDGFPYPIFVYAGLLPWTFFSSGISAAANSVVKSEKLVTKVYFPRLAIPFSSVGAGMVDLIVSFCILCSLILYYGMAPPVTIFLLPLLLVLIIMAALGFGCFIAALNVAYRDIRYVVPYFIQIWLFATPAVYMAANGDQANQNSQQTVAVTSAQEQDGEGRTGTDQADAKQVDTEKATDGFAVLDNILQWNPMSGLISFFRATILGTPLPWSGLGYSATVIGFFFVVGVHYFRRVEADFADIV